MRHYDFSRESVREMETECKKRLFCRNDSGNEGCPYYAICKRFTKIYGFRPSEIAYPKIVEVEIRLKTGLKFFSVVSCNAYESIEEKLCDIKNDICVQSVEIGRIQRVGGLAIYD